jgi:Fe-S-cluster containining protein
MMENLRQEELDILIPSLCTRCGKCCLNDSYMSTLSIDRTDVARWRKQGRADILQYVWSITPAVHDAWVKPDGSECTRCPFVRKDAGAATYKCRIYDMRPQVCRDYPSSYAQMEFVGCEIIDELRKRGIDATGWEKAVEAKPRARKDRRHPNAGE